MIKADSYHQGQEYYENYWRQANGETLFQDRPVWPDIKELVRVEKFFSRALQGGVLDAGCGSGDVIFYLSKLKEIKELVGIDISQTAIEICQSKLKTDDQRIRFIVSPLQKIPFENGYFDGVLSFEVLEHLIDLGVVLKEFNRVLKVGGYLGVSTVELSFLKRLLIAAFLFDKYFDPETPHIRFFTKNSLSKLLMKYGFKVVEYGWTNSYWGLVPLGQMVLAQKIKEVRDEIR